MLIFLFQRYDLRSFQCREFCFSLPPNQVAALAAWRAMPIGPWPWKSCDWCRSVLTNHWIVTDAVTDPMRTKTVESEFWIFVIHLLGNAHVYPCVCFVVFVEVVVSKYNSHIISYVPSLNRIITNLGSVASKSTWSPTYGHQLRSRISPELVCYNSTFAACHRSGQWRYPLALAAQKLGSGEFLPRSKRDIRWYAHSKLRMEATRTGCATSCVNVLSFEF